MSLGTGTRQRSLLLIGGLSAMTVLVASAGSRALPAWLRILAGSAAAVSLILLVRFVHRWSAEEADRRSRAVAGRDHPPSWLVPPADLSPWLALGLPVSLLPPMVMLSKQRRSTAATSR